MNKQIEIVLDYIQMLCNHDLDLTHRFIMEYGSAMDLISACWRIN